MFAKVTYTDYSGCMFWELLETYSYKLWTNFEPAKYGRT